jgi:hypothetical protein
MKLLNDKLIDTAWNSKEIIILFLINLLILLAFTCVYPAIFNWDSINRIMNHDKLEVGHWLPGLQLIIYMVYKLKMGIVGLRISLIAISICANISLYLFVRNQLNKRVAFVCALLFMTTPRLLAISIVPYQEPLMFLLLFLGLYLYSIKHTNIGYLLFGASCLVRYEAWIFCFLFAFKELYSVLKYRTSNLDFKKVFTIPFLFGGIIAALIFKYPSTNGNSTVSTLLNSVTEINSISLTSVMFSRISHPVVIFIFAVLGIMYCLLWMKDRERKNLWLVILFFFLACLLPASLRINGAPSSFRTILIPVATLILFVPFGISLIDKKVYALKDVRAKGILRLLMIFAISYMVFVNLSTANGYYKATYKHTHFDEYLAASKIAKEHRGHKILVIEPSNFLDFGVTSIYLNEEDDVLIYPSLNYSKTKLNQILEKNNFALILRIGDSEDNISEMIEDIGVNRTTKDGIEIIHLN